jgi:hypothetical protein
VVAFLSQVSVGDIVFRGAVAGNVCACIDEHGVLMVIVGVMSRIASSTRHSAKWVHTGTRAVWMATELEESVAWYNEPDGSVLVIRW